MTDYRFQLIFYRQASYASRRIGEVLKIFKEPTKTTSHKTENFASNIQEKAKSGRKPKQTCEVAEEAKAAPNIHVGNVAF